jgi:hypothetical protein
MKKAIMLTIAAIAIFAVISLSSTKAIARDDCECFVAEYNQLTEEVTYHFCLVPPGEEQTDRDYKFWFIDPDTGLTQWLWLRPEVVCLCEAPCKYYFGKFGRYDYDPTNILTWWITDPSNIRVTGKGEMDPCNSVNKDLFY